MMLVVGLEGFGGRGSVASVRWFPHRSRIDLKSHGGDLGFRSLSSVGRCNIL
jgi:hypothetical protein